MTTTTEQAEALRAAYRAALKDVRIFSSVLDVRTRTLAELPEELPASDPAKRDAANAVDSCQHILIRAEGEAAGLRQALTLLGLYP